jgi:zinc-ribbon domain
MAIYCSKCGRQHPDEANFCMICANPLKAGGPPRMPGSGQGRWEYREFVEKLEPYTGSGHYTSSGYPIHGLPDENMRGPINAAVQAILKRVAVDGWEPAEPIDATRLWDAERVARKYRGSPFDFFTSGVWWTLLEVRLNCRRWIAS